MKKKKHPPLQKLKIPLKETKVTASPFKVKSKPLENANGRDLKNISEQYNFTN